MPPSPTLTERPPPPRPGVAPAPSRALTPVLMFLGMVTAVISSLGAPLLPLIAATDHVSLSSAQWSLTAALVSGAVAAPLMGRLGDGRHRRAVILGGLGVVLAGCAIAALATSLPPLVAGRALQGTGLGLLPLMMATARDLLPLGRARPTIALLSVTAAAGVGIGYPLSAFIAQTIDLSAAFWFGALVTAIALGLSAVVIPSNRAAGTATLDIRGAVVMTGGLVALLLALSEGGGWGWLSALTLAMLAIAVILLTVWARHELRIRDPLVDLRLVRHRAVLTADLVGLILGVAMYMLLTVVVATVQVPESFGGFGRTVVVAGLTLLPFSILSLVASTANHRLAGRFDARRVLPVGALAVAAASLFFALTRTALWEAFVTMGAAGIGLGLTFAAMPGLIVRSVPLAETGSATGFYQVSRYVGFSLGSALSASILRAYTHGGDALPEAGGYETALLVAAAVCVLAAAVAWRLLAHDEPAAARPEPEAAEVSLGA